MMPVGPLMIEHRLIERMIEAINQELQRIARDGNLDTLFIDVVVDFIRTYADRCHHGKEEDILFRDLRKKSLSREHKRMMEDLVKDHKFGREITGKLVNANKQYSQGDTKSLSIVVECLRTLVEFYPKHIEKEDKHFFIPSMDYFSQEEKDAMLHEGYEFDRNLIHEKYRSIVDDAADRFDPSKKGK
jgi:hemerythrin-like domain-containing protein